MRFIWFVLAFFCVLAAVVLIAGSAGMNYLFYSSLGQTPLQGYVLGAISVAFDVFKCSLPVLMGAALFNGRPQYVLPGVIAFLGLFGFSMLAEVGILAGNREAVSGARQALNGDLTTTGGDLAEVERKLAGLQPHRAAAVIAQDIESQKTDRRFASSKDCGEATLPASRDFCAKFFALKGEAAAADEETKLLAERVRLRSLAEGLRGKGAGQDVDAQASLLAKLLPYATVDRAQLGWSIGVALLIEFMAAFGLYLATGFARVKPASENPSPMRIHAEVMPPDVVAPSPVRRMSREVATVAANSAPRRKLMRGRVGEDGRLIIED